MSSKTLTNELLIQRFGTPFALVAYAIQLANTRVKRGEGLDSNPAVDILHMISKGEDLLQEDEDEEVDVEEEGV